MHRASTLLFVPLILTGCGEDEDPPGETLSPDLHECVSYTPTTSNDGLGGVYAAPNDQPVGTISAPADLGGGVIDLALTAGHPDLVPGFIVTAEGDTSGAIIAATAAGTNDPSTMQGGFSAAPGQTYTITFTQGVNAPPAAYPVGYTLSWSFTGKMDCYEANDVATEAKQVPVGTTIQAHAFAGYTMNSLTASPYDDWFEVVLNRAAEVEAALTVAPGDHRMRIRFWEMDGTTQLANNGGTAGGQTFVTTYSFDAGSYLMSVEVAAGEAANWNGDGTVPTFWTQPYTIELREAD